MSTPSAAIVTEAVKSDLFKVRRDLEDTKYGLYDNPDIHLAVEALMRAVSTLTLAVERLSEGQP